MSNMSPIHELKVSSAFFGLKLLIMNCDKAILEQYALLKTIVVVLSRTTRSDSSVFNSLRAT